MIPSTVRDFRGLIRWLAETRHGGHIYPMAKALQVSTALVYQWKDGTVKRPSDESLERLCAAYGLDFVELLALTRRRSPVKIRRVPIPIAGGSSNDRTPGVPQVLDLLLLVGHWLRQFLYPWYPTPTWTPRLVSA